MTVPAIAPLLENDRVVGGRRVEAEAVDGDRVVALAARLAELLVTTGVTVATCTGGTGWSRCRS